MSQDHKAHHTPCVHELLSSSVCTGLLCRPAGEVRITGSKGHRQLLEAVLPKLCLYEVVPATLVAQLLQLLATTDEA